MTLFLERSHIRVSTPCCYSGLPRLQFDSPSSSSLPETWKRVHLHRHVLIQTCAVTLKNGGLDDASDGAGFLSSSTDTSPVLKSCGALDIIADSSSSESEVEEPWISLTESRVERTIFNFRFLTLMAIGGSLVGSSLCFLKGCGFICDSYIAYFGMCLNGLHTGKVILRLVEAVEIYLVGTVMLIFGMGLFGLFISNDSEKGQSDRALQNTTFFGMFALQKRPLWMQITSLDTLKTKLGHCIVMILIVKLFEKSKTVCIASSVDLLLYSVAIFLAAGSLYALQKLHASQFSNT